MTNQHPITPPMEMIEEWYDRPPGTSAVQLAAKSAQWGADQELEACCAWLREFHPGGTEQLRCSRRPKPPSLKEQALEQLDEISNCFRISHGGPIVCDKIRKALEELPND